MLRVVRALAGIGLTADTVTLTSLVLGAAAAMFVASGNFTLAALTIAVASLGDALDGALARVTKTASARGAIFDATVDRYEEFFFLAGLAFFFRTNALMLGLVMAAISGSFMVSYGSAKAEALGVTVPPSSMRRPGRAIVLTLGTALVPVAGLCARHDLVPASVTLAPIILALFIVAVVANVSAVRRLRLVGALGDAKPIAQRRQVTSNVTPEDPCENFERGLFRPVDSSTASIPDDNPMQS